MPKKKTDKVIPFPKREKKPMILTEKQQNALAVIIQASRCIYESHYMLMDHASDVAFSMEEIREFNRRFDA